MSQFHHDSYKIKDVRLQLMSFNEDYFNFYRIKTFKYNRTTPAVNGTFNLKMTTEDKIEVISQAQKFLSNEYRHFPMQFQVNLKKAFDSNALGIGSIKNCGNLTTFSFKKDVTYYFYNFVFDATHFPSLMPNGRFRADFTLLYLNEEISLISMLVEVHIPFPYPKNRRW